MMSNMSYCRFENTSSDLEDCVNAIEEVLENRVTYEQFINDLSSDYEIKGFKRMFNLCEEFINAYKELQNLKNID